jgi:PAS domain S-box-containing protein
VVARDGRHRDVGNRVIRTCNPAFAQIFGCDVTDLRDRSFAILYPSYEEFAKIRDAGVKPLLEAKRYSDERIMARSDGSLFWCRVRGVTLTDDGDPLMKAVRSFADLSHERPVAELLGKLGGAPGLGRAPDTSDQIGTGLN